MVRLWKGGLEGNARCQHGRIADIYMGRDYYYYQSEEDGGASAPGSCIVHAGEGPIQCFNATGLPLCNAFKTRISWSMRFHCGVHCGFGSDSAGASIVFGSGFDSFGSYNARMPPPSKLSPTLARNLSPDHTFHRQRMLIARRFVGV